MTTERGVKKGGTTDEQEYGALRMKILSRARFLKTQPLFSTVVISCLRPFWTITSHLMRFKEEKIAGLQVKGVSLANRSTGHEMLTQAAADGYSSDPILHMREGS